MRIAVVGGGLWGSVLAQHLSRDGGPVAVWEYVHEVANRLERERTHANLPELRLRPSVRVTHELESALAGAEVVVVALASHHLRATARNVKPLLGKVKAVVSASKGLEAGTLRTMGEVLEEELRGPAVYAVSGPSFAREVAAGVPTKLMLAGEGKLPPAFLVRLFAGGPVRIVASRDRRGVELGGALKNVMAIASGLGDGLALGANTKAVILTQALAEMERIVEGAGGEAATVRGLAGLGDLIATGTSGLSRNRTLGEHLGGGEGLKDALHAVRTVAEGVESAEGAWQLARKVGAKAPLVSTVREILAGRRPPKAILKAVGF